MPTEDIRLVHVSPRVQAQGGIEALHTHNRSLPLQQLFVALVDRRPEPWPNYVNLDFTWRTTLGRMRRRFARALAPYAGGVVIYHNAWCLPLLHASDGALRRLAACHASPAFHRRDLPGSTGLLDGVVGVTPALQRAWPQMLPELGAERRQVLPLPIAPPGAFPARAPSGGGLVLGHAGRVVREQKRMDRLPACLRALDAAGVRYRFEVLGDGPLLPALRQALGSRVTFHGWTTKDEFWRVIARWDAMLFFTDLEGGPIAMLEGMAAGAIPFYPRIGGSVGDEYAPQVDPRCHYTPGRMDELAAAVRAVFGGNDALVGQLRARAQRLVAGHREADYAQTLTGFVRAITRLPRISKTDAPRPHWSDALPLGFVTRCRPSLLWRRRNPAG